MWVICALFYSLQNNVFKKTFCRNSFFTFFHFFFKFLHFFNYFCFFTFFQFILFFTRLFSTLSPKNFSSRLLHWTSLISDLNRHFPPTKEAKKIMFQLVQLISFCDIGIIIAQNLNVQKRWRRQEEGPAREKQIQNSHKTNEWQYGWVKSSHEILHDLSNHWFVRF